MTSYHEHPGDTSYLSTPHDPSADPSADQVYYDNMATDMGTLSMDSYSQNVEAAGQESSSAPAEAHTQSNPEANEERYRCLTCGKGFAKRHQLTYVCPYSIISPVSCGL
jgi:hypothetical protein